MRVTIAILFAAGAAASLALPVPSAAQSPSDLRTRIEQLEQQNRALQSQLNSQEREIESLKRSVETLSTSARQASSAQQQLAKMPQPAPSQPKEHELPFDVGFRTGWAESPYDLPGGFFWGFYVDHLLLTKDEGIPGGSLSAELLTGVIQGNHTSEFSDTTLGFPGGGSLTIFNSGHQWANTIEIEPTVKYHLELANLASFEPYALVGPSMFITILQGNGRAPLGGPVFSPGNAIGLAEPGNRFQAGSTDFQPGYTTGVGVRYHLSDLHVPPIQPILDRIAMGAEWRYNGMANGEQFQQYTGSVSIGF